MLFAYLLGASALFILGRTVRDTLFLSRYPLSALPWMFVAYGVASAIAVAAYGRLADKLARHWQVALWAGIGIATYLGTWLAIRFGWTWIYPTFYVWSEIAGNLFIVQFWTLANDLHDARAAKRLFGTIGSARLLGVVLVGTTTGAIVRAVGTEPLLFVLCGLMLVLATLAFVLRTEPRPVQGTKAAESAPRGKTPGVFANPYVRVLAVMILLAFAALTIGDYQFKAIARASYREDALAQFFSLFYAVVGVASFLFQILITPRLLARWGVGWGMRIMPLVFGGASGALLGLPLLPVACIMKFADNGLQYTIHDTTLQALYVPFAPQTKARTRAFLDAIVKPLAYGGGGVALALLAPHLATYELSWITLPLVLVWLALIPLVRRRYLAALQGTLGARGALALGEEPHLDSDGRRALLEVLEKGDPRLALVALEQLSKEHPTAVSGLLARLAAHPDPDLRTAALDRLPALPGAATAIARTALTDPVEEVRAAAARAYAQMARDESVDLLTERLHDPARSVRVATLSGLLAHGGVEGGIVGGARMAALLHAGTAGAREEAALALGPLGHAGFRPLRGLLVDTDPGVRRAALRAARGVRDPRLIPLLLPALRSPGTRAVAGEALVAIGAPAVEPLSDLLRGESTPRDLRLAAPRLLREIADPRAYERLRALVSAEDSHLRLRIYAALSRLRKSLGRPAEPAAWLEPLLRQEMTDALTNLAGWEAARSDYETTLLAEEFAFRQERSARRVLRLLELRYPRGPLQTVRACLGDRGRRANALEVLDTLLDADLRPLVMPFFDDRPTRERLAELNHVLPAMPDADEFMRLQCRHPNPYAAFVALDALGRRRDRPLLALAEARLALEHSDPLVREAALRVLAAHVERVGAPELEQGLQDPDPVVARHARTLLDLRRTPPLSEGIMYSTAEKILFLRGAPVFSRVRGEDLAPLARLAEVEDYGPNHVIFKEGDMGDSLYVIVRGKIAVEHGTRRLSTLGPGEAFGEMAILDAEPRSATVRTETETELLRIGSEEFYGVLREQAEIAEGIIRMLTHRLREASAR